MGKRIAGADARTDAGVRCAARRLMVATVVTTLALGAGLAGSAAAGAAPLPTQRLAAAAATAWPQLGYNATLQSVDPARTSLGTGNVGKLKEAWQSSIDYNSEFGGGQDGSPVEGDGMVFVGTLNHHLEAFDAATGKEAWLAPKGGGETSFNGVAAYADGVVYIADPSGRVYAFKASTGALVWKSSRLGTAEVNGNGLTISGGDLLVPMQFVGGTSSGGIEAFAARTGKHLWTYEARGYTVNSTASVSGLSVFLTTQSRSAAPSQLLALSLRTGKADWAKTLAGSIVDTGSATVVESDLVVPLLNKSGNTVLTWLTRKSGKVIGSVTLPGAAFGTVASTGGRLYLGTTDAVYAVSNRTRKKLWSSPLSARAVGGVSVVNGVAYLAPQTSPTGTVLALSAKTGQRLWSAPTTSGNSSNSAPIIVDGSVYVTDCDSSDGPGYLIRYAAP